MKRKTLHGLTIPHHKNTVDSIPERLYVPRRVVIPMSMHIGAPARAVVKAGDEVKVGQLIARSGGRVSSPIHSSVSGKVKSVGRILASNGQFVEAVTIDCDGQQTLWDALCPPTVNSYESFLDAVGESGVVGLGGAGFPTDVKLNISDRSKIEAVIINCAECEPYICSDTRTMLDDQALLLRGIELIKTYLEPPRVLLGIKKTRRDLISVWEEKCSRMAGVEIALLPDLYPQGGEKVLIYSATGKIVPEGGLPLDVGVVVINCTTLAAVARYIDCGMPLVEKCITVDGGAVENPRNVIAPIGTPIRELLDFCGLSCPPRKVLYGGPMMGIAVPDLDQPVLKTTNAILALSQKQAVLPRPGACIRCGRCIGACPLRLMPADIERAFLQNDPEHLQALKVNLCMECGCCAYVCPAKRPLVQVNKLSKQLLRDCAARKKQASEKSVEEGKAKNG